MALYVGTADKAQSDIPTPPLPLPSTFCYCVVYGVRSTSSLSLSVSLFSRRLSTPALLKNGPRGPKREGGGICTCFDLVMRVLSLSLPGFFFFGCFFGFLFLGSDLDGPLGLGKIMACICVRISLRRTLYVPRSRYLSMQVYMPMYLVKRFFPPSTIRTEP